MHIQKTKLEKEVGAGVKRSCTPSKLHTVGELS